jgi:hypothetical protein
MIAIAIRTARSAENTENTLVGTLRKIYGDTFALGESETAKLSDVLAKLQETSLTQLVQDHNAGHLESKVRTAALD